MSLQGRLAWTLVVDMQWMKSLEVQKLLRMKQFWWLVARVLLEAIWLRCCWNWVTRFVFMTTWKLAIFSSWTCDTLVYTSFMVTSWIWIPWGTGKKGGGGKCMEQHFLFEHISIMDFYGIYIFQNISWAYMIPWWWSRCQVACNLCDLPLTKHCF